MGGNTMKKNLIVTLALVFVLGIAGTAFAAANPFVDVPARHWAYDAVTKLAQAGIIDGYGDGTYRGERLATRYEMAQITAKAMARADKADAQTKALIDKLAVEFAAELNNLGVRVAKLEKNAGTIKWGGDSRLRFISNQSSQFDVNGQQANSFWDERLRLYATAEVNDKAMFYGRLMTNWRDVSTYGTSYQASVYWDYGYFEWKFNPTFSFAVGRQQITGALDMFWTNGGYDAFIAKFGAPSDNFTGKIGYGDVGTYNGGGGQVVTAGATRPVLTVDLNYKLNKNWQLNAATYYSTNADKATAMTIAVDANQNVTGYAFNNGYPFQTYSFGVFGNLNPDFTLKAQYLWNGADMSKVLGAFNVDNHNGWVAEVWFKGAQKAVVGSWGLGLNYRDFKPMVMDLANTSGIFGNSMGAANQAAFGMKGWALNANYTFSKNAILTFTYEVLNSNTNIALPQNKFLPIYYLQANVYF